MGLTPDQVRAFYAELDGMGKERVRATINQGTFSPAVVSHAWDWLSKQDADEKLRWEANNSEQMEMARRASVAAERAANAAESQATEARRANTRATIALAIAIISIIVSAIGIWLPIWEAHK